ncbi:MAG TPA: bifunctional metallophosphatase/5'-nucleotidase [candidate division Zixibacteria bacterium]|nr:bifunctional metallophosphatase/5'-nucleotidase [candidate division Zixibacteria bacterium]
MIKKILILAVIAVSICAGTWRLEVFFNNDRHGTIEPGLATFMNPETPPPLGGLPSEFAVVEARRERAKSLGEGFLYLDQGDIYQGAPVGSLTKGMAIVEAYNILMPDAVTIGNHEFDDGLDNLLALVSASKFPWLAANLIEISTGRHPEGVLPFIIREFPLPKGNSLRVGIIGITTGDTKRMSFPEHTGNIDILDEVETANAYAESLRTHHDVDFVILSCHIGLPFDARKTYTELGASSAQYDEGHYGGIDMVKLASRLEGVDVAFGGHIHIGYDLPWEDPTTHVLVFQNYARGTGFGGVRFVFDIDSKVFIGYEPIATNRTLATLFADEFWPDKDMLALVDSLQKDAEGGLAEVIGRAEAFLPRGDATTNRVGHIVCDAMIEATGADVSISNMGGVRAELPAGEITRKDVFAVMPFDNKIVVVPVTGQAVVEIVERIAGKYSGTLIGGMKVRYAPETGSIAEMTIGGAPVDSSATYRFATTDYVYYSYGVPQFEAVPSERVTFTGTLLRTAIERWITVHSPVSPAVDDRWIFIE